MQPLSTLADEFAHYDHHQPIPPEQHDLARTLFYYGAACVIDCLHTAAADARMPDQVQAAFDSMRREVQDFGVKHLLTRMFDDVGVHVIEVHAISGKPQ
ncbi:hypothetical protein [Caballeronia grimmiae]|uniref:Uncharacterized protein n=1 Tax=Caballeronia grimmiae TaxID=1071679 RepID=A0ABQ1R7J9_9BURK|nr:hypothetical protein [Caballeronia grimmiae]GGD61280.1 hypothetical protein GCM10010985_14200 [Caballeronia grimmiae]